MFLNKLYETCDTLIIWTSTSARAGNVLTAYTYDSNTRNSNAVQKRQRGVDASYIGESIFVA
jgi:hypothetical protein